jgi:hypothetical protein
MANIFPLAMWTTSLLAAISFLPSGTAVGDGFFLAGEWPEHPVPAWSLAKTGGRQDFCAGGTA